MDYLNGIKMRVIDNDICSTLDCIESKYIVANDANNLYNSLDFNYDFGFERICLNLLTQATSPLEVLNTCNNQQKSDDTINTGIVITSEEGGSNFHTPEISENPVNYHQVNTSMNSNTSFSSTVYNTIHNLLKPIPTYINAFKNDSIANLLAQNNSSSSISTSICNTQNYLVNSIEQHEMPNESKPLILPKYTDFEEFIAQSSSPFDDVELQTVNEMEELKNILQTNPKNYNMPGINKTENVITKNSSSTFMNHEMRTPNSLSNNPQIGIPNISTCYTYPMRPEFSVNNTSLSRNNDVSNMPFTSNKVQSFQNNNPYLSYRVGKTPKDEFNVVNTYSIPHTIYDQAQSLNHYPNLSNSYPLQPSLPLLKSSPAPHENASTFENQSTSLHSKANVNRPPSSNFDDMSSERLQNLTLSDRHDLSRDMEFLLARTTHKKNKAHSPAPPTLATRLKSSKSLSNLAAQEDGDEPKGASREFHHPDKERQRTNTVKEEYRPSVVKLLPRPLPQTIATKSKGARKHYQTHPTAVHYALSPTLLRKRREELLAVVVSMGFEARYAAKAVEHIGTPINSPHTQLDPKPIIDHLCSVNSLFDHTGTHSKADCQAALFLNEMDEGKARAFLSGLDRLMALGFPVLEIERALLRNDNHFDRALESLLSNSRATLR